MVNFIIIMSYKFLVGRINADVLRKIWNLHEAGLSGREIARKIGLSNVTVSKWIKIMEEWNAEGVLEERLKEFEKEKIKTRAEKPVQKPETAVDKIIRDEIVEKAKDEVTEYILIGKKLKEKLEEHAKAYGYSVEEFVEFLFEFWDKYKWDVRTIEELKKENIELKAKLFELQSRLNPYLMRKKAFYELLNTLLIMKAMGVNVDMSVLEEFVRYG